MVLSKSKNMLVHVLNMAHSTQRWDYIAKDLHSHNISSTRIDAINGKNLSSEKVNQHYDQATNKKAYFWPLTLPEIGCFLSHRKSMRQFLDNKESEYLLLFEDDIQIDHQFTRHLPQWQCLIGTQQPKLLKLYTKRPISGPIIYSHGGIDVLRPNTVPLGAVAQLLNRPTAKMFLEATNSFYQPVDVFYQFWWQHGIDILCTRNSMIKEVSQLIGGSTISCNRNNKKNQPSYIKSVGQITKVKKELSRAWFRAKLSITSRLQRLVQAWKNH